MTLKKTTNYSVVIDSTQTACENVCRDILAKLKTENFGQEDIFAIHLALGEAITNAVKHGNKMSPDKKIEIDYSIDTDKVKFSIKDEGAGFNPKSVPDPREGENIYKTSGRGLLLMNSFMDIVDFNQQGNCTYMVKYKKNKDKG